MSNGLRSGICFFEKFPEWDNLRECDKSAVHVASKVHAVWGKKTELHRYLEQI